MIVTSRRRAELSGAVSGLAGLAAFLTIHHIWIRPIWFVTPIGAPFAALGGVAVGAAWDELRPRLPSAPIAALGLMAAAVLSLAPSFVLGQLRGPIVDGTGANAVVSVPVLYLVWMFVVELLGGGALVGAAIGWVVGRTRRAAGRCALAGGAFALGLGHNVPILGGTTGVPLELLLVGGAVIMASIVFVGLDRALAPSARSPMARND